MPVKRHWKCGKQQISHNDLHHSKDTRQKSICWCRGTTWHCLMPDQSYCAVHGAEHVQQIHNKFKQWSLSLSVGASNRDYLHILATTILIGM